jgi:CBS domain-containing protein
LSFRDLIRLVGNPEANARELTVEDIMRKDPLAVKADTSTLEALTLMRENNIGSLPVVDDDNRLVGLVTVYDLLEIAGKVLEDFLRGQDSMP